MVHHVLPFHGAAHTVGVTDVAHEHFDLAADLLGQGIDPAQGAEGVVVAEGLDLLALFHQFFSEVAADEAISAGNQYGIGHKSVLLYLKKHPANTAARHSARQAIKRHDNWYQYTINAPRVQPHSGSFHLCRVPHHGLPRTKAKRPLRSVWASKGALCRSESGGRFPPKGAGRWGRGKGSPVSPRRCYTAAAFFFCSCCHTPTSTTTSTPHTSVMVPG